MVNRRSVKGIFRFLIKDDGFPFLQKSWNSTWWIKLISQQARFWELFIKSPALRNTKNISFLFQFYSKIQKKGTFYNFKCKRFLKLMTLWFYGLFRALCLMCYTASSDIIRPIMKYPISKFLANTDQLNPCWK